MKVHILQHADFEGPGYVFDWAKENNHSISFTKFFEAFSIPLPTDIDFLIILGGPMSIDEESKYPWLAGEKDYVFEMINKGKKVLGICFGSQLIADALGSEVFTMDEKEIGWFPIKKNSNTRNSWVNSLPDDLVAFHWHGQTYDLPQGSERLFSSQATTNQGFSYKRKVYAVQLHLEIRSVDLNEMVKIMHDDLTEGKYVHTANEIMGEKCHFAPNKKALFSLLDHIAVA